MRRRPNLAKVELIAQALGPLRERLVFVGGCAVDLLLTDVAAAPSRVTFDVDLVAQVAALSSYHALEAEFAGLGFKRDLSKDAPICRWRMDEIEVDLMPSDINVLGFANRWYPLVVETAQRVELPSDLSINLVAAPLFLATKFEAFHDRGCDDWLGSHDLEDIINVLDGRPELVDEIAASPAVVRDALAEYTKTLLAQPQFVSVLPGLIFPDESLELRLRLLEQRIREIAVF
jgi:predicted nucleotidyltransferase